MRKVPGIYFLKTWHPVEGKADEKHRSHSYMYVKQHLMSNAIGIFSLTICLKQSCSKTGLPDAKQNLFLVYLFLFFLSLSSIYNLLCEQLSFCYLSQCLPFSKCKDCLGLLCDSEMTTVQTGFHFSTECAPLMGNLAWYFRNFTPLQLHRLVPCSSMFMRGT